MGVQFFDRHGKSRPDRPAPTSYRDEAGRFHPGPGCEGHREHVAICTECLTGLGKAVALGERWAIEAWRDPDKVVPIAIPIAGPGVTRGELARRWHEGEQDERHALLYLRPQHIGPCAVAVGALSYGLTALGWWWALGILVALLVVAGRRDWLGIDRTPRARLVRR